MSNPIALPRLIGATLSSVLAIALIAALAPASALAEEEPPALAISPVAFPNTTVQTESAAQAVDVVNSGEEAALTESPMIEGPASGEFKITNNGCGKLFAGEHCTIWVSFAPGSEAGEKEATLVLPSSNAPSATALLSATAVLPELAFSPSPLEFGLLRTNSNEMRTVQLTNEGEARAHVDWFGFSGPDSGNFYTGNNNCGGTFLEPGQSCFVDVWFNPHERRDYEAALQAQSAGQTFTVELLGTGGNAELAPESNPIELGSAVVGSQGTLQTIELTNVGNMEGGYFIGIIAGGNAASFQLLDETCTGVMIVPNATCVAHVRFAPTSAGPKSARLAFFGDGEGGTLVELRGEGIAPSLALTPSSFDFGTQAPGSRGAPQSFVLRNSGAGSISVGSVSILGADLDQFALAGDECSDAVLVAGGQCTVKVRFAPDSTGAKAGRLRIATAAGSFTAALSGLGDAGHSKGENPQAGGSTPAKARHRRKARFKRNKTIFAARAVR